MNKPSHAKHPESPRILTNQEWHRPWHNYNVWLDSFWPQSRSTLPSDNKPTPPKGLCQSIFYSKWFRAVMLVYAIFCVFISCNHLWQAIASKRSRFDVIPERTYDYNSPYSLMDNISHSMKMAKMSVGNYDTVKNVQPYWLKASDKPVTSEVTIVTLVTVDTMHELVKLASQWQGSISAVLEATPKEIESIRATYTLQPILSHKVDIHLIEYPTRKSSNLISSNAERNIGRMYARTDYVCEMPSNVILSNNLKGHIKNVDSFEELMRDGHMLVLPMFRTQQNQMSTPNEKEGLLQMLEEGKVTLSETEKASLDLEQWKASSKPFLVQDYSFHYDPIIIQSKSVLPWCPERFTDSHQACVVVNYFAGGELWVLPNSFLLQRSRTLTTSLMNINTVIESRLLAKFYWEQCVFQARNLAGMGLWRSDRSKHIRGQCFRVIRSWAKGLIE